MKTVKGSFIILAVATLSVLHATAATLVDDQPCEKHPLDHSRSIRCSMSRVGNSAVTVSSNTEPSNGMKTVQTPMKGSSALQCSGSQLLHIVDASFGTPEVIDGVIRKGESDAPQSVPVVRSLCENKNSCSVASSADVFKTDGVFAAEQANLAITYMCLKSGSQSLHVPMKNLKAKIMSGGSWELEYNTGSHELYPSDVATDNFDALTKQYVHLLDFEADCASPITRYGSIKTIDEAETKCSNDATCNFFIYTPMSATLCSSGSYTNPRMRDGSKVYVKASVFAGTATSDFQILANAQAVCDRSQLVGESYPVLSVEEAASACQSMKTCDFFTMSTVKGVKGAAKRFENYSWMCSGEPIHVPHAGFIVGQKISKLFPLSGGGAKPRTYNSLITSPALRLYNGPLEGQIV